MRAPDFEVPGGVTLRFEERVDAAAALRARELVERGPRSSIVVLDFTRVRTIDWFALATLAVALAGQCPGRVVLRGMCDHHARLLKHLGLDVDRLTTRTEGGGPDSNESEDDAATFAGGSSRPRPRVERDVERVEGAAQHTSADRADGPQARRG